MTETQPQNRRIGYARVSTYGQTLDAQLEQLRAAGCSKIYREKVTGAHNDRRELLKMLDHLAAGRGDGDADRPPRAQRRFVRHQRWVLRTREDAAAAASGDQRRTHRNLVEMVYPGGIAAGDLGLLLFSAVRQNLFNDLPAPGEGGLDMGVI